MTSSDPAHEPSTDDPTPAGEPVRWGFLATGKIARSVAADLALVPSARLVAVGARRLESAEAFVAEHAPGTRAHASYADLVADPDVEVVYVASPHALHLEHARMAIEAGKHVMCEKPLTLNARDAEEMVRLAREHDVFLMEAMWSACHPVVRELRERLHAGDFGTPRQLRAELGFVVSAGPDDRLLDPALGASALLDMGIYPLTFAHLMLGAPEQVTATASLSEGGIDGRVGVPRSRAGQRRGLEAIACDCHEAFWGGCHEGGGADRNADGGTRRVGAGQRGQRKESA